MTAKLDLTCEGRLEVHPYVTDRKYMAVAEMVRQSRAGGIVGEEGKLKLKRALMESEAIFSFAHIINVKNLEGWDTLPRNWSSIAALETVDDFNPTTFYRLQANFDNLQHGDEGGAYVSPIVPQGANYPSAYGFAEEAVKAAIRKRGFKFAGITLEDIINDSLRKIRTLPDDMLEIALDTDEYLVFNALQTGVTSASELIAGTYLPTGASVPANAPMSAEAFRVGLSQIPKRADTLRANRRVQLAPTYHLVVALGNGEMAEAELERGRSVFQIQDGSVVLGAPSQGNLRRITDVIESQWITDDDAWYLVPDAGSTRRPGLVKLELAGRTAPEVLVQNFTGAVLKGTSGADPFTVGHFDNDSVELKLRQFTEAALLGEQQMVWSNGSGS